MKTLPGASGRLRAFVVSLVVILGAPMMGEALAAGPEVTAAGDIACPDPCRAQRQTARLIRRIDPRAVLTLGDNQYPDGRFADFMDSYRPTWGRFRRRTHPTPGNHEYNSPGARGYFRYFRRRAHRRAGGTYGVRLGAWQLVSINSGNGLSARDLRRTRRILARGRGRCELAFWHHPRWSSGSVHGPDPSMGPLWKALFRRGVDVALNGHDHFYERFGLMTPSGRRARRTGIRQFTVGTGGRSLYPAGPRVRGSQKVIDDRFGVLRLVLHPRSYSWRFVAVGGHVLDRGRRACHR
jgi:acid phosphatase type 7